MSADRKRLRETIALAKSEGLELAAVVQRKHIRLTLRAPDGRIGKFTLATSPSCPFEGRLRSQFRRFARGPEPRSLPDIEVDYGPD